MLTSVSNSHWKAVPWMHRKTSLLVRYLKFWDGEFEQSAQHCTQNQVPTVSCSRFFPVVDATALFLRRGKVFVQGNSPEQFGMSATPTRSLRTNNAFDHIEESELDISVEAIVHNTEMRKPQTLRHKPKSSSLQILTSPLPNLNRSSFQPDHEFPTTLTQKATISNSQDRSRHRSNMLKSLGLSSVTRSRAQSIREAVMPVRQSLWQTRASTSVRHGTSLTTISSGCTRFPSLHGMHECYLASIDPFHITTCKTCGKRRLVNL